jgi:hypothetical protein
MEERHTYMHGYGLVLGPLFLDLPAPPRPQPSGFTKHSICLIHPIEESAQVSIRGLEFTLDDLLFI